MNISINAKKIQNLLSHLIKNAVIRKIGQECDITVTNFNLISTDESTNISIEINGSIDTNKIPAILRKFGIL